MKNRTRLSLFALLAFAACTPTGPSAQSGPAPMPIGPGTLNVADAAIAGGDPNMALSVTQSVLANDPHNEDALVHEGDAYYALGRCISAQAAYNLALATDPKSTAAETGLGRCLLKTDPRSAELALLQAVQDDPGNAAAYNDLGIARDLQGNFAGAVAPYQRALNADPELTAAEVNLGLSLALSGNGPQALQYLGPLATGPGATPKIREDYAAALVASGRETEARTVLSIDLPPDQVNSALDGFSAVIAGAQAPLAPGTANAGAVPATEPAVQTAGIAAAPLAGSVPDATPVPLTPAVPPPASYAPPPQPVSHTATTQTDLDAAYTGPPPIPVTASSSTPGPGAPPVTPAATPTAAVAPPAPPAATFKQAIAGTPTAPPPVPPPVPAATGKPADPPGAGSYKVQLASLNSQSDAAREWDKLSSASPVLFGDKQPDIESATVNGKTYYRLRTGAFGTKLDAAKFCVEVAAAGNTCTLANF